MRKYQLSFIIFFLLLLFASLPRLERLNRLLKIRIEVRAQTNGSTGATGYSGPTGSTGATGPVGPNGETLLLNSSNALYPNPAYATDFKVDQNGYLQFLRTAKGDPPSSACDNDSERGRFLLDIARYRLYICIGASRGWDYTVLRDN